MIKKTTAGRHITNGVDELNEIPLHTVAAPALRAAVKPELSYRNDTKIAIFFAANKNKHNVKVDLTSSKSSFENSRINLARNSIFCSI